MASSSVEIPPFIDQDDERVDKAISGGLGKELDGLGKELDGLRKELDALRKVVDGFSLIDEPIVKANDEARKGITEATRLRCPPFVPLIWGNAKTKSKEDGAKVHIAKVGSGSFMPLIWGGAKAKREEGERDVRIKIGSDTNETDLNWQELFEYIEKKERLLNNGLFGGKKVVEEIMVATTGQAAISLMGYYMNSSALPGEAKYVMGANAVGFVGSLASLLLREKNKKAALVLGKIGAIAASSAVIMAMTMSVPANHRLWVSSLACLLPAVVVALA